MNREQRHLDDFFAKELREVNFSDVEQLMENEKWIEQFSPAIQALGSENQSRLVPAHFIGSYEEFLVRFKALLYTFFIKGIVLRHGIFNMVQLRKMKHVSESKPTFDRYSGWHNQPHFTENFESLDIVVLNFHEEFLQEKKDNLILQELVGCRNGKSIWVASPKKKIRNKFLTEPNLKAKFETYPLVDFPSKSSLPNSLLGDGGESRFF